jgi:urea transport system substrate-binding protein
MAGCGGARERHETDPIRVGILHSLSGTMEVSERGVAQATQLAVEEINAAGGLLGRPLEIVLRDGASVGHIFAREAERLITNDGVAVIFGCWTSDSRRTVRPIIEQHQHLLFYPVQYEGMEYSPNIIYMGAAPNQQLVPGVKWAIDQLGHRFFLVGSDYVFPRAAHAIMRDQIQSLYAQVVGEAYIPLGSTEVDAVIDAILAADVDVILNTLNGDSNAAFFRALRQRGITPNTIPTISFSIAEAELQSMGSTDFAGDYAVWNYFQSLPGEANTRFVRAYQTRFGTHTVLTDPMESAYTAVHLWAHAVRNARSTAPETVLRALAGLSLAAPQGPVSIDPHTQHLWQSVRIGQIRADGQFTVIWESGKPIRPLPYPPYRSPAQWQAFLDDLQTRWQGNWAAPGTGEDAP